MAEFITKCPHCNNDLQVQDEWDGIEVECPICSKTFTVRKPSSKLVKNNSRTSSARKYYCSNCKKEYPEPVKFCSECGSKIQNKSSNGAKKASSTFFWAMAILIGVSVLLMWAHKKLKTPTPKETVKTISSNTADSSSEKSYQTHESKISVSVTVKKWTIGVGELWKYGCDYKLYANEKLIASRSSRDMSVSFFNVSVPKGAVLRATMEAKNGFGGTELLEGPLTGKIKAQYSKQHIEIACW